MRHTTLAGSRTRCGTCGADMYHVLSGWMVYVLHEDGYAIGQDLEAAGTIMSPAVVSYDDGAVGYCPFPVNDSLSTPCCKLAGPEIDDEFSGDVHTDGTVAKQVLAPNVTQSDDTVFRGGQTTAPADPVPKHPVCSARHGPGLTCPDQTDSDLNGGFLHDSSTGGPDSTESWMDRMGWRHAESVCIHAGSAVDGPSIPVSLDIPYNDGVYMQDLLAGAFP